MCEWVDVLLGEVANLQGGYAFSSDLFTDSGVPLTRMNSLKQGHIDHSQSVHVPSGIATKFPSFLLREGDLLLGMSGSLSNYAVVRGADLPALLNQRVMRVSARSELVEQKFLCSVLTATAYERYAYSVATGNAQLNISSRQISEFEFSLPPLPHQRKIAKILSTVDNLIEKTEVLIAKYQSIKQGMMHDLFTRGVDENGKLRPPYEEAPHLYKESELGWIPKEWEVATLSAVCDHDITYGIVQAGPNVDNGVPYIRTGDMMGAELNRSELLCTSPEIAAKYRRSEVRAGEIVCAIRATVGKVHLVPLELDGANLTQGTARISGGQHALPRFLLWAMRTESFRKQLSLVIKGTTFLEITLKDLRETRIVLPSLAEQRSVMQRLEQLALCDCIECVRLDKLRSQKQALMQDLLTGKIQVTPDPEDYEGVA